MKINRVELINILSAVKPGLATEERIEQSTSFVFQNGRVVTYNDEVAVSHPVNMDIEGAISAKEFLALLSKLKDDSVELTVSGSELRVNGKKARAGIKMIAEIALPINEIQEPKTWEPLPEGFAEAIKFCIFSCSKDLTSPALTCLHVHKDKIESCDNFRITIRYLDASYFNEAILLPASAAKDLINYNVTEYAKVGGWLHFRTKADTVFSCRTYGDLEYPNLERFLEIDGGALKFPEDTKESLARAGIFSTSGAGKGEERVKIVLSDGLMVVHGEGDTGWFEESSRVRYKGGDTHFEITPSFLEVVLSLTDEATVGNDRLKFEGDNFVHVVSLLEGK